MRRSEILALLGLEDLDGVAAECRHRRRQLNLPTTRWTAGVLAEVLAHAVIEKGWPANAAVPALHAVAADPATESPARLSFPGPWWDAAELDARHGPALTTEEVEQLAVLEARLGELGGERVRLQRQAREQLAAAGEPVTRFAVAALAWGLHRPHHNPCSATDCEESE